MGKKVRATAQRPSSDEVHEARAVMNSAALRVSKAQADVRRIWATHGDFTARDMMLREAEVALDEALEEHAAAVAYFEDLRRATK